MAIPSEPGHTIPDKGVWYSVASPNHPNYPVGCIMSGPFEHHNAPRPEENESKADWIARRYAAGFVDKVMTDMTPQMFVDNFTALRDVIPGSEKAEDVYTTYDEAVVNKTVAVSKLNKIFERVTHGTPVIPPTG